MGQLKNLTITLLLASATLLACKPQKNTSQLDSVALDRFRAEKFDRDLLLIEKELTATLSCRSATSSASISGMAIVTPDQKRLEVNFGRAIISVSSDSTCQLDIYGEPLDIAGMALIKRSNSPEDNLLYTSKRVELSSLDQIDDFLDEVSILFKVYEINTDNIELDKLDEAGDLEDATEVAPDVVRAG